MADTDTRKIKRKLEASEKQISGLLQSYRSILEFIDKMERRISPHKFK